MRPALQPHACSLQPRVHVACGCSLDRLRLQPRAPTVAGAGNVFGTAQKGMSAVGQIGLDMYLETLQRAMKYLQETEALDGSTAWPKWPGS